MADFSYICKNLAGSASGTGTDVGAPKCSKNLKPGTYCSAASAETAAAARIECPSADFLKILTVRKKKW